MVTKLVVEYLAKGKKGKYKKVKRLLLYIEFVYIGRGSLKPRKGSRISREPQISAVRCRWSFLELSNDSEMLPKLKLQLLPGLSIMNFDKIVG